jgi:hypothetical protein
MGDSWGDSLVRLQVHSESLVAMWLSHVHYGMHVKRTMVVL